MPKLLYKKLFEVRLLYDYRIMKALLPGIANSLLSSINTSFFSYPPSPPPPPVPTELQVALAGLPLNQKEAIIKILSAELYDVSDFFAIKPTKTTLRLLNQYKIRFIQTTLGFFLAIQVKEEKTIDSISGNSITNYKPFIQPLGNPNFQFFIDNLDSELGKRTQPNLYTSNDKRYYFTNTNPNGSKSFPSLSENNSTPFTVTKDDLKFSSFRLKIPTTIGTTVQTKLSKAPGPVVVFQRNKTAITDQIKFNLQNKNIYEVDEPPLPDDFYDLEINDGVNPVQQDQYFFSSHLFQESNWGLFDFYFDAQDNVYDLLDSNSFLKTKYNDTTSTLTPHPIFELRLKGPF